MFYIKFFFKTFFYESLSVLSPYPYPLARTFNRTFYCLSHGSSIPRYNLDDPVGHGGINFLVRICLVPTRIDTMKLTMDESIGLTRKQ